MQPDTPGATRPSSSAGGAAEAGYFPGANPVLERIIQFAWIPIPLFWLALGALWYADLEVTLDEPRYLLPVLNFIFRTAIAVFVAYLAWRGFARNGYLPMLLLSCGMLFFGLASLVSGFAVYYGNPHFALTVFNTGMWFSGACHLVGALAAFSAGNWVVRSARLVQISAFAVVLLIMSLLAFTGYEELGPFSLIHTEYTEPVREMVLASAVAMFALAAGLTYAVSERRNWFFGKCYALALALIGTGIFGIMIPTEDGELTGWVGRSAQYLGGLYLLGAALLASRRSGEWDALLYHALRESEYRFRAVVENSRDAIHQFDLATGRYIFVSPSFSELCGFTADEIMAMPAERLLARLHPEDRAKVQNYFNRIVSGEVPKEPIEYRWRHKNGEYLWFSDSRAAFRDANGQVVSLVGVSREITARKRHDHEREKLREELEQRVEERTAQLKQRADQLARLTSELTLTEHRERGRLAQVLHDHLQQLLVGAKFALALVSKEAGAAQKEKLDRVDRLLNESIDTSRSLTVELSPPILHEGGLAAALQWLGRWAEQKFGLQVKLALDTSITTGREEVRLLLFEAARELLLNISKYAHVADATITLRTAGDRQLCLTVEDTGVGFDPDDLSKRKDTVSGGYGLFSIRERLNLLGGELKIESAPGKGARFTLLAPISPPQSPAKMQDSAKPLPSPQSRTPAKAFAPGGLTRILLVDDHTVMRQGLSSLLMVENDLVIVGEASNGREGVELAKELDPDVILMDFSMPDLDGIEATRILHREQPKARVIGLSMYDEYDRGGAMLEAGAAAYVSKSGKFEILLATIRRVAAESRDSVKS